MTLRKRSREGFTLIELLMVMAIIVMLTTLAVLVVPSMNNNRAAARAADQTQGWLVGAKNRAIRDQAVRGIRLLSRREQYDTAATSTTVNEQQVTELQFIEQPEVFLPRAANGAWANAVLFKSPQPAPAYPYGNTARGPNPATAYRTLNGTYTLRLSGLATSELNALRNMSGNRSISLGDVVEINIGSYYRFRVEGIIPTTGNAGAVDIRLAPGQFNANPNVLAGSFVVRPGQIDPNAVGYLPPGNSDPDGINEFKIGVNPPQLVPRVRLGEGQVRVVRRPRAVVGEQNLELPKGTLIDMKLSSPFQTSSSDVEYGTSTGAAGTSTNFYDILFGSNGQVVSSSNSQRIVLWIRSEEDARWNWKPSVAGPPALSSYFIYNAGANAGFGSPTLISINVRTGTVASHPVDQNTTQVIDGNTRPRPYAFVEDGRGDSGL